MKQLNILHFVALVLLGAALFFLYNSARSTVKSGTLLASGQFADGKVVRVEGKQVPGPLRRPARTYCPLIRFETAGGTREFLAECQSPPLAREGETVRVVFTRSDARIYGVWNMYLRNLVSLLAGVFLLVGAILVYKRARSTTRSESGRPPGP